MEDPGRWFPQIDSSEYTIISCFSIKTEAIMATNICGFKVTFPFIFIGFYLKTILIVKYRWCYRNCAHVNIEVAYGGETILTDSMVSKLYETLMDSMSSLESLVITTKEVNYHSVLRIVDFSDLYETRSSNFLFASKYPRTIWIDGFAYGGDMTYNPPHDPDECASCNRERDVVHLKSINMAYMSSDADQIPYLHSIEHVSNETWTKPTPTLPALRYLRWREVGRTVSYTYIAYYH